VAARDAGPGLGCDRSVTSAAASATIATAWTAIQAAVCGEEAKRSWWTSDAVADAANNANEPATTVTSAGRRRSPVPTAAATPNAKKNAA
jgi:hypothetical protein